MNFRSAALLVVALSALPRLALADRVVVGSIRGDSNERIRERVESTLRERVEVVPWSEFREAYRGMDAEAIRAACRTVHSRAIVIGDVQGRRRMNLLALSCETGEIASEATVELRRGLPDRDALNAAIAAMFFQQGARSLLDWANRQGTSSAAASPPPPERATPAPPSRPAPASPAPAPPAVAAAPAPAPAATPTPAAPPAEAPAAEAALEPEAPASSAEHDAIASLLGVGLDDETPTRTAPAEDLEDAPASSASVEAEVEPEGPAPAFLEAAVGATFATRSLDVIDRTGKTIEYSGGGYTELGVAAALFPLAIVSRAPWARAIGVTGSFTKGVAVPVAAGTGLAVDVLDGDAALVGRFVFGRRVRFELRPQVGYGFRGFAIDWNPDIATFNYRYLRIGAEARAHLLERHVLREGTVGGLTVGLSGGYRVVTDLGEAAAAYGSEASGAGWDVGAFATVLLGHSLQITAGGELARMWATFDGAGSLERLAQSSNDLFPRAYLRVGVALR